MSELPPDVRAAIGDCLAARRWDACVDAGTYHERHAYLVAAHGVVLPATELVDDRGTYRCTRYLRLSDCGEEHERHLRRVNAGIAVKSIHRALGSGHLSAHDAARQLRLLAPWTSA